MFKVVSLFSTLAFGLQAGVKNSLDIAVLEQAKDVWFDTVTDLINSLTLPDLEDGHGNYLKDNTFVLNQRTDEVHFITDVENNAVILKCDKLSAVARSNSFRYKETIFVAKGHAEVDINTITVQAGFKFETQTLPDGRVVPKIIGVDVDVDMEMDMCLCMYEWMSVRVHVCMHACMHVCHGRW